MFEAIHHTPVSTMPFSARRAADNAGSAGHKRREGSDDCWPDCKASVSCWTPFGPTSVRSHTYRTVRGIVMQTSRLAACARAHRRPLSPVSLAPRLGSAKGAWRMLLQAFAHRQSRVAAYGKRHRWSDCWELIRPAANCGYGDVVNKDVAAKIDR
jgi:hypothetical protein